MKLADVLLLLGIVGALASIATAANAAAPNTPHTPDDGAGGTIARTDNDLSSGAAASRQATNRTFYGDAAPVTPINGRLGDFLTKLLGGPLAPIIQKTPGGTDYTQPLLSYDQAALQSWNFALAASALADQGNTIGRGSAI